jgi:hypothetical protein
MTFRLRCLLLNGSVSRNGLFTIEIPADRDVDALKVAICERNHYTFPPYELTLWQVSIPVDAEFEVQVNDLERKLSSNEFLTPSDDLSDIFPTPPKKTLHVVVRLPPSASLTYHSSIYYLMIFFLTSPPFTLGMLSHL